MTRNYENKVNTLQARTINNRIEKIDFSAITVNSIEKLADSIVNELTQENEKVFPVENYNMFMAYTLNSIVKKAYTIGIVNLYEYIAMYAHTKKMNKLQLNDKGFFGDLFEVLVRIIIIDNINLVRASALSVAEYKRIDIQSKKYGKIEIGQNGKTWNEGLIDDYMFGNYDSVIYGMFSDIDIDLILTYCENKKLEEALKEVKKRTVYWQDKNEFMNDMNHLGHNGKEIKAFTIKSCKVMNQFTTGMYFNFMEKIEQGIFKTLE